MDESRPRPACRVRWKLEQRIEATNGGPAHSSRARRAVHRPVSRHAGANIALRDVRPRVSHYRSRSMAAHTQLHRGEPRQQVAAAAPSTPLSRPPLRRPPPAARRLHSHSPGSKHGHCSNQQCPASSAPPRAVPTRCCGLRPSERGAFALSSILASHSADSAAATVVRPESAWPTAAPPQLRRGRCRCCTGPAAGCCSIQIRSRIGALCQPSLAAPVAA